LCRVGFYIGAEGGPSTGGFYVKEMEASILGHRDFALLVRQKPGDYMKVLSPAFSARGLHLRNEAEFIGPICAAKATIETYPLDH
jgi:hypothetical protein